MLYIVATPIGNLSDITLRAQDTLRTADLIACEDTRRTKILLDKYNIKTPTTSYFEHNKITKGKFLLGLLKEGKQIALVSDAGTPGISDPGFNIIRLAIENEIPITVIPGASALISALVVSGMPTDRFIFEGFLPNKKIARQNKLKTFKTEKRTMIFYESPYRILDTLKDIKEIFGDIKVALIRELTKKFEEILRDKTSNLIDHFRLNKPRGEFILVMNPKVRMP